MKSNYKIGEIVEEIDIRNTENDVKVLLGLSINKHFIKSVANTIGTDLKKYKVIFKDDFAVSLMQVSRDDKIPIACLQEYNKAIVSPAYHIFRIKNKNVICPEYLELLFRRSEFDREAAYIAVGGVRGSMPWSEFCRINLSIPPIEKQLEIVHQYKVISDRIALKQKINDKLENIVKAIYMQMFSNEKVTGRIVKLIDIADIICGKTPATNNIDNYGKDIPFITIPDMHGNTYVTNTERFLSIKGANTQSNKFLPENAICVSCIATVGLVSLTSVLSQTNQQINSIICKKDISPFYVYLKMKTLTEYLKQLGAGGSTTLNVNKTLFSDISILLPDMKYMKQFHQKVSPMFEFIKYNQYEINILESFKNLILAKI